MTEDEQIKKAFDDLDNSCTRQQWCDMHFEWDKERWFAEGFKAANKVGNLPLPNSQSPS